MFGATGTAAAQPAPAFGGGAQPGFAFGQQNTAAAFGAATPAYGQAPAPAFGGNFGGAPPAGFAAGTSNAAGAGTRRKTVRRVKR